MSIEGAVPRLTRASVLAAAERIRGRLRRTPTLRVERDGYELLIKCEQMQVTGSFKPRGAFNRILRAQEDNELDAAVGVVVASGGNAGVAYAYAAAALGVPAAVFVPVTAPGVKVDRLRAYGASVHRVGGEFAEALEAASSFALEQGALFCHAYDQPEVAAGAGTLAEEILEDDPDVDAILLSVGGGGLFAGVAASVEGRARVIAVEPERIPTLRNAIDAGSPVDVEVSGIAADSLGGRRAGEIAFDLASRTAPTSLLVDDDAIVKARRLLWDDYRIAAEHGAATALAALTSGAYEPRRGERISAIVCGANADPGTLR